MIPKLLEKWHRLVDDKDVKGLGSVLSDDAIFHSPVVHTPQIGKKITEKYLAAAFNVLFNDTFEYVREIVGEREAMLEFVVELDGIVVNGVDIITWNENRRIVDFKVMIRPLKAINVVRDRMMKELQSR
jgi:SnoaL-like domain